MEKQKYLSNVYCDVTEGIPLILKPSPFLIFQKQKGCE